MKTEKTIEQQIAETIEQRITLLERYSTRVELVHNIAGAVMITCAIFTLCILVA